jgi:hypothetical protein
MAGSDPLPPRGGPPSSNPSLAGRQVLMKGIMKETMAMEMATDLQTWEILGSVHTITICSNGTGDTTIFVAVDSMGIQQFL